MIAPERTSTTGRSRWFVPNSSGMSVSAAGGLPPAVPGDRLAPIAMTKYHLDVDLASTMRFWMSSITGEPSGIRRCRCWEVIEVVVDRLGNVHD